MKPSARRISYAAIAAAFAVSRPFYNEVGEGGYRIWMDTVLAVTDVLGASNPKFNRKRFLQAAGVLVTLNNNLEDVASRDLDREAERARKRVPIEDQPLSPSAASQHYIDTGRRVS